MQNKIVVITGASRGLGRHLAIEFAQAGAQVIAVARNQTELQQLAQDHSGIDPRSLDLRQADSIRELIQSLEAQYGHIDFLINNAGWGLYKDFDQQTSDEITDQITVNFTALVQLSHAVLPKMKQRKTGHILNIGSDLARRPLAKMAVYAAAKHAVAGFSHSLLREVKTYGIKVSLINPGIIDTYFGGGQAGSRDESWALQPAVVARLILDIAQQPGSTLVDEISLHPLHQDF